MTAATRFTAWLRRVAAAAELISCRMARIHFDAPWRENRPGRC